MKVFFAFKIFIDLKGQIRKRIVYVVKINELSLTSLRINKKIKRLELIESLNLIFYGKLHKTKCLEEGLIDHKIIK